jgi:hypothetical protein
MAKETKGSRKAPRTHQKHWQDNTITARSDKRKAQLRMAAELNGFDKWSTMLTYIKNQALDGKAVVKQ